MRALDADPADPAGHPWRVLIAGGGTGGHLFPALAIAEALLKMAPETTIRFAGSRHGIEHRVIPERGYRLHRIPVRGLYGVSWLRRLWVLAMLPFAFFKCAWILLAWRPHLVMGVGGYASGPMLATALLFRFRCVIQEQNAAPGMTNRLLGRFVPLAFTAVEDAGGWFRRAVVTGNPVRAEILALRDGSSAAPPPAHGAPAPMMPPAVAPPMTPTVALAPLVLILGGSQGAHALNAAMGEALPLIKTWKRPPRILHQSGPREFEAVRESYRHSGFPPENTEVRPFIDDMAAAYREARIVVSRAGASAIAEIVAARRASLLVPIPGTSGEHQLRNAERLAGGKAAVLIEQRDLSGERLAGTLKELLDDPARLDAMAAATDALFQGDAAVIIARACLELMAGRK